MTDFDRADLMTRTEVAEAAGLSIDTIAGLTAKMPAPVAKVVNESGHGGRQSLWRRSEIEAWVASRGGRGPKPGWYPHKPSGSTVKQSSPREIAERMVTEMLSVDDAARLAGMSAADFKRAHREGLTPAPDGTLGATAWWWQSTITKWVEGPPRQVNIPDRLWDRVEKVAARQGVGSGEVVRRAVAIYVAREEKKG